MIQRIHCISVQVKGLFVYLLLALRQAQCKAWKRLVTGLLGNLNKLGTGSVKMWQNINGFCFSLPKND